MKTKRILPLAILYVTINLFTQLGYNNTPTIVFSLCDYGLCWATSY